jgi:hypothetical protein
MDLRDKIQGVNDIKKETVKEWDCNIEVRTMTALQRAILLSTCVDKNGEILNEKFQAAIIIGCCFDPKTGQKIFTEQDENWIMEKSAGPIERISQIAMKLSGLTGQTVEQAEKK